MLTRGGAISRWIFYLVCLHAIITCTASNSPPKRSSKPAKSSKGLFVFSKKEIDPSKVAAEDGDDSDESSSNQISRNGEVSVTDVGDYEMPVSHRDLATDIEMGIVSEAATITAATPPVGHGRSRPSSMTALYRSARSSSTAIGDSVPASPHARRVSSPASPREAANADIPPTTRPSRISMSAHETQDLVDRVVLGEVTREREESYDGAMGFIRQAVGEICFPNARITELQVGECSRTAAYGPSSTTVKVALSSLVAEYVGAVFKEVVRWNGLRFSCMAVTRSCLLVHSSHMSCIYYIPFEKNPKALHYRTNFLVRQRPRVISASEDGWTATVTYEDGTWAMTRDFRDLRNPPQLQPALLHALVSKSGDRMLLMTDVSDALVAQEHVFTPNMIFLGFLALLFFFIRTFGDPDFSRTDGLAVTGTAITIIGIFAVAIIRKVYQLFLMRKQYAGEPVAIILEYGRSWRRFWRRGYNVRDIHLWGWEFVIGEPEFEAGSHAEPTANAIRVGYKRAMELVPIPHAYAAPKSSASKFVPLEPGKFLNADEADASEDDIRSRSASNDIVFLPEDNSAGPLLITSLPKSSASSARTTAGNSSSSSAASLSGLPNIVEVEEPLSASPKKSQKKKTMGAIGTTVDESSSGDSTPHAQKALASSATVAVAVTTAGTRSTFAAAPPAPTMPENEEEGLSPRRMLAPMDTSSASLFPPSAMSPLSSGIRGPGDTPVARDLHSPQSIRSPSYGSPLGARMVESPDSASQPTRSRPSSVVTHLTHGPDGAIAAETSTPHVYLNQMNKLGSFIPLPSRMVLASLPIPPPPPPTTPPKDAMALSSSSPQKFTSPPPPPKTPPEHPVPFFSPSNSLATAVSLPPPPPPEDDPEKAMAMGKSPNHSADYRKWSIDNRHSSLSHSGDPRSASGSLASSIGSPSMTISRHLQPHRISTDSLAHSDSNVSNGSGGCAESFPLSYSLSSASVMGLGPSISFPAQPPPPQPSRIDRKHRVGSPRKPSVVSNTLLSDEVLPEAVMKRIKRDRSEFTHTFITNPPLDDNLVRRYAVPDASQRQRLRHVESTEVNEEAVHVKEMRRKGILVSDGDGRTLGRHGVLDEDHSVLLAFLAAARDGVSGRHRRASSLNDSDDEEDGEEDSLLGDSRRGSRSVLTLSANSSFSSLRHSAPAKKSLPQMVRLPRTPRASKGQRSPPIREVMVTTPRAAALYRGRSVKVEVRDAARAAFFWSDRERYADLPLKSPRNPASGTFAIPDGSDGRRLTVTAFRRNSHETNDDNEASSAVRVSAGVKFSRSIASILTPRSSAPSVSIPYALRRAATPEMGVREGKAASAPSGTRRLDTTLASPSVSRPPSVLGLSPSEFATSPATATSGVLRVHRKDSGGSGRNSPHATPAVSSNNSLSMYATTIIPACPPPPPCPPPPSPKNESVAEQPMPAAIRVHPAPPPLPRSPPPPPPPPNRKPASTSLPGSQASNAVQVQVHTLSETQAAQVRGSSVSHPQQSQPDASAAVQFHALPSLEAVEFISSSAAAVPSKKTKGTTSMVSRKPLRVETQKEPTAMGSGPSPRYSHPTITFPSGSLSSTSSAAAAVTMMPPPMPRSSAPTKPTSSLTIAGQPRVVPRRGSVEPSGGGGNKSRTGSETSADGTPRASSTTPRPSSTTPSASRTPKTPKHVTFSPHPQRRRDVGMGSPISAPSSFAFPSLTKRNSGPETTPSVASPSPRLAPVSILKASPKLHGLSPPAQHISSASAPALSTLNQASSGASESLSTVDALSSIAPPSGTEPVSPTTAIPRSSSYARAMGLTINPEAEPLHPVTDPVDEPDESEAAPLAIPLTQLPAATVHVQDTKRTLLTTVAWTRRGDNIFRKRIKRRQSVRYSGVVVAGSVANTFLALCRYDPTHGTWSVVVEEWLK